MEASRIHILPLASCGTQNSNSQCGDRACPYGPHGADSNTSCRASVAEARAVPTANNHPGVVMKFFCLKSVFSLFLFAIIIMSCDGSATSEKEKPMTQQEQLVGAWKFLSMRAKKPDGQVLHPYGEDLYGMLVYTASGHMSFLGMRRDRPQFASAHIWANARFAPARKCFALPFIPSRKGREGWVPSPFYGFDSSTSLTASKLTTSGRGLGRRSRRWRGRG